MYPTPCQRETTRPGVCWCKALGVFSKAKLPAALEVEAARVHFHRGGNRLQRGPGRKGAGPCDLPRDPSSDRGPRLCVLSIQWPVPTAPARPCLDPKSDCVIQSSLALGRWLVSQSCLRTRDCRSSHPGLRASIVRLPGLLCVC